MQGPAGRGQLVDPAADRGVLLERRRVVGLESRVDDEGAAAAPVLVLDEGTHAGEVVRRITAGEGDPQEVVERSCREVAVIDYDD